MQYVGKSKYNIDDCSYLLHKNFNFDVSLHDGVNEL